MVKRTIEQSEPEFYVYVVFRKDGTPCYVGKGARLRWQAHLRASHNQYLRRIAAKDGDLPIVKIREDLTETDAFEIEVAFIHALGRLDLGTGPLVNLTSGGDGVAGRKQGVEQIEKLRKGRLGRRHSEAARKKVRLFQLRYSKSLEHRAAISAAKKGKPGKPASPEMKAKMSAAQRARWTPEMRVAASVATRRRHIEMSPEEKAAISAKITAKLTGKKLTPEHRARISEVQRGKKRNPISTVHRQRLSDLKKGADLSHLQCPEIIAKRKATWAAKREAKEIANNGHDLFR